jgi:hypothetical protein
MNTLILKPIVRYYGQLSAALERSIQSRSREIKVKNPPHPTYNRVKDEF